MIHDRHTALEVFLVQDVILTLGGMRGTLGWLGRAEDCSPVQRAEALARITRQIGAVEDRARALWQDMRTPPPDDAGAAANLFLPEAGEAALPARAIFRTCRAGA